NQDMVIPIMAACLLARAAASLFSPTPVYKDFAERMVQDFEHQQAAHAALSEKARLEAEALQHVGKTSAFDERATPEENTGESSPDHTTTPCTAEATDELSTLGPIAADRHARDFRRRHALWPDRAGGDRDAARAHSLGGSHERAAGCAAAARRRGGIARWRLGHPGPDRLPYPSGLRWRPRR